MHPSDAGYDWAADRDQSFGDELDGMAHTSVAVMRTGEIAFGHSRSPELVFTDSELRPVRRLALPFITELHGLTVVQEGDEELLWIADTGMRFFGGDSEIRGESGANGPQVVQVDLRGERRRALDPPPSPDGASYSPTCVVVDEQRRAGSGDIWVSDGYGAGLVHRYTDAGSHVQSLDGVRGAGRFGEPHGLLIDRRRHEPELYVTDRQNRRIQVYDLAGDYVRSFGDDVLIGPTFMTTAGDRLLITDLLGGRVTIFDRDDRFVAHVFARPDPIGWDQFANGWPASGWPNARAGDGTLVRPALTTGAFNSPHGIGADRSGRVYVSEFVFGGRVVALAPQS